MFFNSAHLKRQDNTFPRGARGEKKNPALLCRILSRLDKKDATIQDSNFIKSFNVALMFSVFSFVNPEKK